MKSRVYIDEKSYYNQLAEMRDSYARLQDYQKGVKAIRQKNADAVAEQSWNFTQMQTAETVAKKNNIAHNFPVSNRSTSQTLQQPVKAGHCQFKDRTDIMFRQDRVRR